jgi:ABC-type enterochelin transport system permease subunit
MLKKKLLLISILTILFIAIFHYFALKNSWYWTFRWLDIPVHVVGGFWVSLTVLWICLKIKHIDSINGYKKKALIVMLSSVLIVAIFWEIFELVSGVTSLHNVGYWQDSLSDISNSFVGGIIAFLYFIKNKKAKNILISKPDNNLAIPLKTN